MSYLVLARKYRPQTFEEMVGQAHVTRTLSNAISSDRVAHAILFSGPRGTGKTTAARILAKAMNCAQGPTHTPCNTCRSCLEITAGSAVDVFEIDGASNNGVDHVRDLRENVKYKPAYSPFKIYIIDEVHMLSTPAFNALLKTLEEPPPHVMFLFATTEPQKIPITILSRCQRHDFRRISLDDIRAHMKDICRREEVNIDEESLTLIARQAGGSMRDALSLLDQVVACASGDVTGKRVIEILGAVDRTVIFDISGHVLAGDMPSLLNSIDDIYKRGHDIKELYAELLDHFRNLMVLKMGGRTDGLIDLPQHEIIRMKEQVQAVSLPFLSLAFDLLFQAEASIKLSEQPRLALELAFLRMQTVKPALPIDTLIEKLDDLRQSFPPGGDGPGPVPSLEPAPDRHPGGDAPGKKDTDDAIPSQVDAQEKIGHRPGMDPDSVWKELKEAVSAGHPSLAPHLEVSSLVELTEDGIEIEVNGNNFNANMLRRKKNLDSLKQVFQSYFGKPMHVKIRGKGKPSVSSVEEKDRENQVKQAALQHPLVADAVEIFNGQVVDVKILKKNGGGR